MGIDYRNSEGYLDPTYHDAMANVMKEYKASHPSFRPLVYICSPYSGDIETNLERTNLFCRMALDQGNIPIAPQLMFSQFMRDDDPEERELALFMDIVLLGKCHEVWVLGDTISAGMQKEIDKAKLRQRPIRWFTSDFQEVEHL